MKSPFRHILALTFALAALTVGAQALHAQNRGGGYNRRGQVQQPQSAYSQNNQPAMLWGNVYLTPEKKGEKETPGAGVTVVVYGKKFRSSRIDTLYTTVGSNGRFYFNNLSQGDAYVKFSMVGYEDLERPVKLVGGENKILANLSPKIESLDAAVIKASVPPISVIGDTLVFNAAAVKTNKGEAAIDILEQMPGVEVSTTSVTILGQAVTNVYVDGALLFGKAPMAALNNLPAEEVVTIKSYQEYANKDPRHKISKNEQKERVLDITTKSKHKMMVRADATAGGGFDTDTTFHKLRYVSGVNANLFSESLQINFSASLNNINDPTVRRRGNAFRSAGGNGEADFRDGRMSLSLQRNWMSKEHRNYSLGSVNGSYSFSDNFKVTESMSERIYFANEQYDSRSSESKSYNYSAGKNHNFAVGAAKSLQDGTLNLTLSYSVGESNSQSYSSSYNYQDALPKQGTASSTESGSKSRSFNANFSGRKGFFDKLTVGASARYGTSAGDGGSSKIDTTTSTITATVLDISSDSKSYNYSLSPYVRLELSDRSSVSLTYDYSNSFSQSWRYAYDVTDPLNRIVDEVNTQLRTNDNNAHTGTLSFSTAFGKTDNLVLSANLAYKSSGINRRDEFPDPEEQMYSRRFNSFRPYVSFSTKSQIDHWELSWTSGADIPSVEQLRPKFNNSNLYSVSAGNPDLRQSTTNSFNGQFSTVLGREARKVMREMEENAATGGLFVRGSGGGHGGAAVLDKYVTFNAGVRFSVNNDVIVNKKTYYTVPTVITLNDGKNDISYTMPAQSTFSTYENAASSYSASASAYFGIPVEAIRCVLTPTLSMSWDKSPSYVNSVLTQTENLRPTVSLGLRTFFSRNFRVYVNGNASYVHSYNSENNSTDYFTEAIRGGFEFNNIFKIMYLGGNYTKTFMQGIEYKAVNDNILDMNAGLRFGPRNNYDFALVVHDLFNKTSGFSTSMSQDYVLNRWTHNFGRYVMLRFTYQFMSMGGGKPRR